MDHISAYQFWILGAMAVAGFGALAWQVGEMRRRLARVFGGTHSSGDLMNDLLQRMIRVETQVEVMGPRIDALEAIGTAAVQKVGFLRFNPFQDTGGDNSFIIVLLDAENTGFIMSSLYMREGTRLYAKAVERGSVRAPLSDEEQKLLDGTMRKK